MERKIEYKKPLKIDKDFLCSINEIFSILSLKPLYKISTVEKATYTYNDINLLLNYNFDEEISEFYIEPLDRYSNDNKLEFSFRVEEGVFINYTKVSYCKYTITDDTMDANLKEKINNLYKNHSISNYFISQISFLFMISLLVGILIIIYSLSYYSKNGEDNTLFLFLLLGFFFFMSSFALRPIDYKLSKKFFPPLLYYMGYQKQKWDRVEKLRSNIFWGIFVALIIGIVGGIVVSLILK